WGGDRDLDAELVGPVRLVFADALHLGGVQAVDLASALSLALFAHPASQRERDGKNFPQCGVVSDLAADVADHPAKLGTQRPQRTIGALELLGVCIALM